MIDARQRQTVAIDQHERAVRSRGAQTVNSGCVSTCTIKRAIRTLTGAIQTHDGGHCFQYLLHSLRADLFQLLAAHRDEVRAHGCGALNAGAGNNDLFQRGVRVGRAGDTAQQGQGCRTANQNHSRTETQPLFTESIVAHRSCP